MRILLEEYGLGPRLHYCVCVCVCVCVFHSLTPLITNCLNLPFGTQGRSKRLKPFSYKQEMGDTERPSYMGDMGGPHRVLLDFKSPFHLVFLDLKEDMY